MPGVFDPVTLEPSGSTFDPPVIEDASAAERLYRRWEPYWEEDAQQGYPLYYLAEALTLDTQEIDDIVRDTDTHEAWHVLFDPAAAPAYVLPWLAQFAGVKLLPADTEDQQRARIQSAAGFYRGTQRAIREEVQQELTGTKTVRVVKTGPWALTVLTRTAETPDPDAAERAARRQKPAGVKLLFVVSDEPFIDEGTLDIDDVTTVDIDDPPTLADVT